MFRHTLSIVTAGFLAVVVGAQGPKGVTPQQQADLFKKNQDVIKTIVDQTVESSRTPDNHVSRAKSYYDVLLGFNREILVARQANDQARAADLTRNLGLLLDKGLAPTLAQARGQVEGGTGVDEFKKAREQLLAQLDALLRILETDPAAKASLDGVRQRLEVVRVPQPK